MGIKRKKPVTPTLRQARFDDFSDITETIPEKSLIMPRRRHGGRNAQGKITVRHRGGGAKRSTRIVDYKRDKFEVPAKVVSIEYDPNRGARLALLNYKDGEKRYIIAPIGLKVGDQIVSKTTKTDISTGNAMPIKYIPAGVAVHCVELDPGKGGRLARGAGNSVSVMGIEGEFAQIKAPSGEIRLIKKNCMCTIGQVSNPDKSLIKLGGAGRKRRLGIRPTVRGTAMNPVDHPHGGGEGKQSIGLKYPKTPWGKPALGVKTRNPKKPSSRLIIKRRGKRRRR